MKEEIFGPVAKINVFDMEDEVIKLVKNTEYGLHVPVYTRDVERAMRFAKTMEAGNVGINCTSPNTAFDTPFGGFKASRIGREGIHHSMNSYLETKTMLIRIGDA
ncbi:hypothetical protein N7475_008165 [Penicillium sp. IBT 31633x]|nr:hypothetical protein N7475_008165 [Penicillium sp. IBT 31633x]